MLHLRPPAFVSRSEGLAKELERRAKEREAMLLRELEETHARLEAEEERAAAALQELELLRDTCVHRNGVCPVSPE
jgi:E3 ubiquitin-protein ligase DOA10